MRDPSLVWLETLPDLRVPGVPGVPPQKSAISAGTPRNVTGVPGVPDPEGNTREHLVTAQGVPNKPLNLQEKHPAHLGTPEKSKAVFSDLSEELAEGLARLPVMPRPRIARPEVWTTVVADAIWLAQSGWAGQALKLGWGAGELFGVSADPDWQSLAVWLDGRRPLLIGERTAFVDKDGWRAIYNRRSIDEVVMLWDLGR